MKEEMFKLVDRRYAVDGAMLRNQRLKRGLTGSQFAAFCGWSQSFQSQIECNRVVSVNEAMRNVMISVLSDKPNDGH